MHNRELYNKIRKIQIATKQLADDLLAGVWHSTFKGRGMEFEEVREYQTGDEIRSIDWNVTARMNHPYVKVFREERELTVFLMVDVSASSRFGSCNVLKKDLMAEMGATLAFSAIKNNDNVGLILFSEEVEKYIPPKKGTRHVLRLIRELLAFEPKKPGTNIQRAVDFLGGVGKKPAICFLLSDFLCPLDQKGLAVISKKHDLIAIAVSDPYERAFPKIGFLNLMDLETGHMAAVDATDENLLEKCRRESQERLQILEKTMSKCGAGFMSVSLDQPYLPIMQRFFKQREIMR